VSVRPLGQKQLGTKVEIKNLNSFRYVQMAIDYEVVRQIGDIESGKKIIQETRLWDVDQGVTKSMRSKEEAHDYRYFPEPDLPYINLEQSYVNSISETLAENPAARKLRFVEKLGLSEYDASVILE